MTDDLRTVVLVPTLWRSLHLEPFLDSLREHAGSIPVRPLFLCQGDDRATLAEVERLGVDYMTFRAPRTGEPVTMVHKCNTAAQQVTEPFLFGASDDIRFTPGCLERCHEALRDPGVHVACVNDGVPAHIHSGELTGHCLIRMDYIRDQSGVMDEPNLVMHPGYRHYYSDMEFWHVAHMRGVYRSVFDARVEHPHPNNGTAGVDRVQDWSRRYLPADRALYQRRSRMWRIAA